MTTVSFDLARRRLRPNHHLGERATGALPDPAIGEAAPESERVDSGSVESAVVRSLAVDSAAVESGAVESGVVESGEVESVTDESGVADELGAAGAGSWPAPSWSEIVEQHSARVFRLAYRLTGNRHDAEDLTQDVFVRVFRALPTFTPGNFEAWLHRITTNLFLDGARRRKRIRFDALDPEAGERLADPAGGPDERYHLTNLGSDVREALLALRPEYRAAVVLADIEGLAYDEVAAALGIKLGTVRSRIHRGRAQLREQLAHRAPANWTPAVQGGRAAAADTTGVAAVSLPRGPGPGVGGVGVALGT